jgi:hypothetical protein
MALIACTECGREISDKASACPGCGAPVLVAGAAAQATEPDQVQYDTTTHTFTGTMLSVVQLAMRAVQELRWTLGQSSEATGLVTFETGMSLGSWSGVSCSLCVEELTPGVFRVTGTGKQNVRGGQLIAFNLGGEAEGKARQAIAKMKELAMGAEPRQLPPALGLLSNGAELTGREIYYVDGVFTVEGEGPVDLSFVRSHQVRGQIAWFTPKLQEWAAASIGPVDRPAGVR